MTLDPNDECRLAEAIRLAEEVRPVVWPGWAEAAPFGVLMVDQDWEHLVGYPDPLGGFMSQGQSAALKQEVWRRPRHFDPVVSAAFPAFGGEPVIVIGRPEALDRSSTSWVLVLLHEHFHQLQMADVDYGAAVDGLDLAGEDRTGMWMLTYPFPYGSTDIQRRFSRLSRELASALVGKGEGGHGFWAGYDEFLSMLSAPDRAYLRFQIWQEGVARYVELRAAEVAAEIHTLRPPSPRCPMPCRMALGLMS